MFVESQNTPKVTLNLLFDLIKAMEEVQAPSKNWLINCFMFV